MKNIIYVANCEITDSKSFGLYPLNVIIALWNERKKLLTARKSCNYTEFSYADWLSIFSLAELPKALERITNNYTDVNFFIKFNDPTGKEIFLSAYKKMLITCNVILINSILLSKMLIDRTIVLEIPNIKNLALLAQEYWLFENYNHETQKFALQCCKTCKTCTSAALPDNFSDKLQQSCRSFEGLIQFYYEVGAMKAQFLDCELLTKLVTFWTQVLWN